MSGLQGFTYSTSSSPFLIAYRKEYFRPIINIYLYPFDHLSTFPLEM